MGLVGACASLVECLSVLPSGFAGFDDGVLQMNRGNPDNYGFINSLNDPSYIRTHIHNMRAIWQGDDSANIYLDTNAVQGTGVSSSSTLPGSSPINPSGSSSAGGSDEIAKSMIGVDIDLTQIYNSIQTKIVNYLSYIFEPVQHSFTNDIMSNHIQNIGILLVILTAIISIFFISFLFNITLFIFSGRLMSYFTNKYILWYLNFNKKIIAFEIIILSCWIGYLLYVLLVGLHYIATHPVIYSSIGS